MNLSDRSDPESDVEIQNEDSMQNYQENNDRYYIQWDENFGNKILLMIEN